MPGRFDRRSCERRARGRPVRAHGPGISVEWLRCRSATLRRWRLRRRRQARPGGDRPGRPPTLLRPQPDPLRRFDLIWNRIAELGDWRGETLSRMRKLIKEADPDVVEEWKWMGTPVWSHDGIICT